MTQAKDPKLLRSDGGVAPELKRALHAMRNPRSDKARIERVAMRLGPLLDAPVRPSPIVRHGPVKGLATKLVIATIAIGTPVFFLAQKPSPKPPTSAVAAAIEESEPTPVAAPEQVESEAPLRAPAPSAAAPAPRTTSPALRDPAVALKPAKRIRVRASSARSRTASSTVSTSQGSAQSGAAPSRTTSNIATASAAPSSVAPPTVATPSIAAPSVAAPEAPMQKQTEAERPAPSARPLSETELLLAAHQRLRNDPQEVLRLVAQHEARFPSGRFVPEREVLAVEALRRVGRDADARSRSERLRDRFPDYFRAVSESGGAHKAR